MNMLSKYIKHVYHNDNDIRICEFAGRKCYNSPVSETMEGAIEFIERGMRRKHEAIIEFTNMVVAIDLNGIDDMPMLLQLMQPSPDYIHYLRFKQIGDTMFVHGNYRAYKDLIRRLNSDTNLYLEGIIEVIYRYLPMCFFTDMVEDGTLRGSRFIADIPEKPPIVVLRNRKSLHTELIGADFLFNHTEYEKLIDISEKYNINVGDVLKMGRFYTDVACQRYIANQIITHRTISKAQQSQRYVKFTDDVIETLAPEVVADSNKVHRVGINGLEMFLSYNDLESIVSQMYQSLLTSGVKAEDARAILLNSTMTEMVESFNYIDFLEFVTTLRTAKSAQKEFRELTVDILNQILILENATPLSHAYYNTAITDIDYDNFTVKFEDWCLEQFKNL